jgi:hypothetical protein
MQRSVQLPSMSGGHSLTLCARRLEVHLTCHRQLDGADHVARGIVREAIVADHQPVVVESGDARGIGEPPIGPPRPPPSPTRSRTPSRAGDPPTDHPERVARALGRLIDGA